jgi:hypothetical protein
MIMTCGTLIGWPEMLEAIQADVTEDPPIAEVEAFFKLLKDSEESLHEHT